MRIDSFQLVVLAVMMVPSFAWAHAVGVEAKIKEGKVVVEGFFDDDTPAADAKVRVTTLEDQLIVEGRTDAQGRWSFATPAPGRYRIILDAGAGHVARMGITIPGVEAASDPSEKPANEPLVVSEGPSREEFTRFRGEMLLLGLILIAAAGFLLRRIVRPRRGSLSNHKIAPQ